MIDDTLSLNTKVKSDGVMKIRKKSVPLVNCGKRGNGSCLFVMPKEKYFEEMAAKVH